MTGALAAFIATPCTGPFMGAALGAALVLPWPAALAVFAGLGLGIALPFLLLGFVPALRKRLPRPGAWMETLRHILSCRCGSPQSRSPGCSGGRRGRRHDDRPRRTLLAYRSGLWWTGCRRQGKSLAWLPAYCRYCYALQRLRPWCIAFPGDRPPKRYIPGTERSAKRASPRSPRRASRSSPISPPTGA
jgi:hypothetical protein